LAPSSCHPQLGQQVKAELVGRRGGMELMERQLCSLTQLGRVQQ
jgi:hypothetical protein